MSDRARREVTQRLSQTPRSSRIAAYLALVTAAAVGASSPGCGDPESGGGAVSISHTRPIDLDPAGVPDPRSAEVLWLVYTPLLTYRHAGGAEGSQLIPGLAEALPEVSSTGTEYSLRLRDDLRYSDGTAVRAEDFEHAIKRALNRHPSSMRFLGSIAGAEDYLRGNDPRADISGIEADSDGQISIHLSSADARFERVLAMPLTAPVPAGTEFADLSREPPPGVGAYAMGRLEPDGRFTLERSSSFEDQDIPEIPTGSIDTISVEVISNREQQAQGVLDGKLDYMQDLPPAELKPTVLEQASDRYDEHPTASTDFFFLNRDVAPFDDPLVREGANFAVDRARIAQLSAGALQPGCAFLAPGVAGYDPVFDVADCPYGDPRRGRDLRRARQLIDQAGATGTQVSVWGVDAPRDRAIARAYARMLADAGLDAEPILLPADQYSRAISMPKSRAQTGVSSSHAGVPHPLSFFALVEGRVAKRSGLNPGHIDDPLIDTEIERLRASSDLDAVEADWRELDRYLVSAPQSYLIPYGHRRGASFFSERIEASEALFHPVYMNDYSSWLLKEGE